MEYIQCPHCQKKYSVNEKVRAASGKSIRCKSCQESFEINIFSTPVAPSEVETPEADQSESKPSNTPSTEAKPTNQSDGETSATEEDKAVEKPKASAKKEPEQKNIIQIAATLILGLALIAGLIFAYQLSQTPQRPKVEPSRIAKPVVREPIVTPVTPQPEMKREESAPLPESSGKSTSPETGGTDELAKELSEATAPASSELTEETMPDKLIAAETPSSDPAITDSTATEPSVTKTKTSEEIEPRTVPENTLDEAPENPSDACKLAATDQWFIDYMITHGALSGSEYVRMLDESSSKTEEVRTACNDKYLSSKITDAARQDIKPEWIRTEINARASSIYGKESKGDGKW